ncbi:MAG: CBS domain-containing protein [Chloroflexi bacterium]|nr:CBS domain-containing protein [Chloroflexota bacterium]
MLVRTHMTRNPFTATPETTHPQAVELMRRNKLRRLPVVARNRLVGIVVEKDLLSTRPSPATTLSIYEIHSLLARLTLDQIMTHPVVTVQGDCPMEDAARIMVERRIGCLPVMEGEALVGIITETDIFRLLVEVLGGDESGHRLMLRLPDRVGELARTTARIAEAGGNIIAVTTSHVSQSGNREVTIKEKGADPNTLSALLSSGGVEVLDFRSSAPHQPRLFG